MKRTSIGFPSLFRTSNYYKRSKNCSEKTAFDTFEHFVLALHQPGDRYCPINSPFALKCFIVSVTMVKRLDWTVWGENRRLRARSFLLQRFSLAPMKRNFMYWAFWSWTSLSVLGSVFSPRSSLQTLSSSALHTGSLPRSIPTLTPDASSPL